MIGLLWKELRQKMPPLMLVAVVVSMFLTALYQVGGSGPSQVAWGLGVFISMVAGALLGWMAWGTEKWHGTLDFSLQLPVTPATWMITKWLASAITWLLYSAIVLAWIVISPGLELWPLEPWHWWVAALCSWLVWVFFARLSLLVLSPVAGVTLGTLFVALVPAFSVSVAHFAGFPRFADYAWWTPGHPKATGLQLFLLLVLGLSLWRAVVGLQTQDVAGRLDKGLALSKSLSGWTLRAPIRTLGRPNWQLAAVVFSVLLPALSFWAPLWLSVMWLGGAVLGSCFLAPEERNGAGFFLHHLPVKRFSWVLPRIADGLLLGLAWSLVSFMVQGIMGGELNWRGTVLGIWSFFLAFGLAAMLSIWSSDGWTATILAFLTTMGVHMTMGESFLGSYLGVLLPAVAWALAYWSLVLSRALEPWRFKVLFGLALLLPFWSPFAHRFLF